MQCRKLSDRRCYTIVALKGEYLMFLLDVIPYRPTPAIPTTDANIDPVAVGAAIAVAAIAIILIIVFKKTKH